MKKYMLTGIVALMSIVLLSCSGDRGTVATDTQTLIDIVGSRKSTIFTVAFDRYGSDTGELPIGVFDSGIGGLTVLAEIIKLDHFNNETHKPGPDGIPDFKNERFIYLGDQANMPYGNYPSENKTAFLLELVIKDAVFLLGQRYWLSDQAQSPRLDKPPVKAIVIACNTATAYGLDDVRDAVRRWKLPVSVIGVVEAGAQGAVEALAGEGKSGVVAVMATVGTCASEGYVRAVDQSAKRAGVAPPEVVQQGCLGLASAVEGDRSYITPPGSGTPVEYRGPAFGNSAAPIDTAMIARYGFDMSCILGDDHDPTTWRLNSIENYIRYHTAALSEQYRLSGAREPIAAVILGCTHFPYRRDSIAASFARLRSFRDKDGAEPYRAVIADSLIFIDPSELTAEQLYQTLAASGLLLDADRKPVIAFDEFYISVPNAGLGEIRTIDGKAFTYEYKYGREPGRFDVEYVKRVPMSRDNLSESVMENIRETMPGVWERLVRFNRESDRCRELPSSARIER